ncbi:MAG: CRISPR-associated endoribonuclease Cas6 [Leptolyngbya sp. SIO4C1]|nr:CRISPR-associated endoribonuclease Cas6 [Leptolyngbya sp. SIO4C1]
MPRSRTAAKSTTTRSRQPKAANVVAGWSDRAELVGLTLLLTCEEETLLYAQYTIGLHAWLLGQIQKTHPALSRRLHDNANEKAFAISSLDGAFVQTGQQLTLRAGQVYRWQVTALSNSVVKWLSRWLPRRPEAIDLRGAPLQIKSIKLGLPPTDYKTLVALPVPAKPKVTLSFLSPTSFRRKGNHFPLPLPVNLYHSYLRRWQSFAKTAPDQIDFLDWIDAHTVVLRHHIQSKKVAAGKRGSVTGFVGAVELGLDAAAYEDPAFVDWFYRLAQFAPYCGTGHKTTFGLGQTQLGWQLPEAYPMVDIAAEDALGERIAELTTLFTLQRKRVGGSRAHDIAETWATILARREQGESLIIIAEELDMNYETVKTYSKLARRALRDDEA